MDVMQRFIGSISNFWIQVQNYSLMVPYVMKEMDRKYNPLTSMRKLNENDDDLPKSLTGKVCIITGGTRGIGAEVVKAFLRKDCHVITGSSAKSNEEIDKRYKELMEDIPEGKGKLEIWNLDLKSMSSVMKFVEKFKSSKLGLNYLIANAGIMLVNQNLTEDGFESHFEVNYLSHCLLVYHLLPNLVESGRQFNSSESRIVMVSSAAHLAASLRFDDLQLQKLYSPYFAYGQSKLALIMFTYKLSRWLDQKSDWGRMVKVHTLHPGVCKTDIISHIGVYKELKQYVDVAVRVCLLYLNLLNFFFNKFSRKFQVSNYFLQMISYIFL
jgi:NAD(P)-dependent dehydrogenase (short-subunit alcohol dehydrogenase family)